MRIVPVLLSGGVGTRLWPLSRAVRPKQLQPLVEEHSMLQSTLLRLRGVEGIAPPIVVCGGVHALSVASQLRQIDVQGAVIIAEPGGRSTAAAIAAAALVSAPDDVLVALPADHVITDGENFRLRLAVAVDAAIEGRLVTFGVKPTRPETGYGYIEVAPGGGAYSPVARFVEKPDAAAARDFVDRGNMFWNSGMFVFRSDVMLHELEEHAPAVLTPVRRAMTSGVAIASIFTPGDEFLNSPTISIDHAVMEKTSQAVMVELEAGWSDVGSWEALFDIGVKQPDGNVVVGERVVAIDVTGSYLRSSGRMVAVVGLDDVVVVETSDAVLVVHRDHAQDVRRLVEHLDSDLL